MNVIKMISSLVLATMFFSGSALAEDKKLSEKLSDTVVTIDIEIPSCDADAAILCPGLPLNSQKSLMCLMAYEDNLSLACKLGIVETAMMVELSMMAIDYSIEACEADADKYCGKVEAGEGRIVQCLRKNESKISERCTSALKDTGLWELGAQ
mgnify:FL=1